MKEFMIIFEKGQEYLISVKKLRWVYEHGLSNIKYYKKVDAVLSVAQWEGRHNNPDNGYYCFYYNGKLIKDFTIDRYSDKNLVIIRVKDEFPGYEPGHTAYVKTPYSAKVGLAEKPFKMGTAVQGQIV